MASSLKEVIEQDEYMKYLDKLTVMLTGYHVYQVSVDKMSETMSTLYDKMEKIIELTKKLDIGQVVTEYDPNKSSEENINAVKQVVNLLSDLKDVDNEETDALSLENIEIGEDEVKADKDVETLNLLDETKPDQWYSKKSRELAESGKTEDEIKEEADLNDLIINYEKDKEKLEELVTKKQNFWAEFKKEFGVDSLYDKAILGDDEVLQFDLQKLIEEIEEEERQELNINTKEKGGNNMAPIV